MKIIVIFVCFLCLIIPEINSLKIGEDCQDQPYDCGWHAVCSRDTNKCTCYTGYIPDKDNDGECIALSCNTNNECLENDVNSECAENSKTCTCQEGYIGYKQTRCRKPSRVFTYTLAVVVCLLVILPIGYCWNKKDSLEKLRNSRNAFKQRFQNMGVTFNPQSKTVIKLETIPEGVPVVNDPPPSYSVASQMKSSYPSYN